MAVKSFSLPWRFRPRPYQLGLFKARERGVKRMVCVWHRRAGKDKCLVNLVIRDAFQRVGSYYYYFPTSVWARKAIWDGMDKSGMPFKEHFPTELVRGVKDREMQVEFVNGSIFQIIGTDTLDVVGVNPVGCVFSEYSLQNPKAWEYITPILLENEGWAAFNFTPRGKNHAWTLYEMAKKNPRWYCEKLTIKDTGAISEDEVAQEIAEGIISKELAEQEYYCSFDFGMEGSIFSQYMRDAGSDGRIDRYPYDRTQKVYTFWDLGVSDAMSVWFGQLLGEGEMVAMIDHVEERNRGLDWFKKMLEEKGYDYGVHFAPHDVAKREQTTGSSVISTALKMGIRFEMVPRTSSVEADIELVRRMFPKFAFDEEKCQFGLMALSDWHRDPETGKPVHDRSSHAVDAFRTACRAVDLGMVSAAHRRFSGVAGFAFEKPRQTNTGTLTDWNPLDWNPDGDQRREGRR